jgi:hypothetical protein
VAVVHEAVSRQLFDDAVKSLGPELRAARGWSVLKAEYPRLELEFTASGRRAAQIRVQCDGWDGQPPSIVWIEADGSPSKSIPQAPGGQLNNSAHPLTGLPFVCMAGTREYHTHSSHVNDLWEDYKSRASHNLGGIITQVWRAWLEAQP